MAVGPLCRSHLTCHLRTLPYVEASLQNRTLLLWLGPISRHLLYRSNAASP